MDLEIKIKELMKPDPMIIAPDESLADVSKKMAKKGKDIVVIMDDGVVQGLVTASDIYFAMKTYVLGENILENIPMEIRNIKISELMKVPQAMEFMEACGLTGSDRCIVLREDDSAADAIRVMAVSGIDHIPVSYTHLTLPTILLV